MELFLNRFCQIPANSGVNQGNFGSFQVEGEHYSYSVEPPWLSNKRYVSCVPDGLYDLILYESPKYGWCFIMVNPGLNVYAFEEDCMTNEDRFLCLFAHLGSFPFNFEGCAGLGREIRVHPTLGMMLTKTRATCRDVMRLLGRERHTLNIYSPHGCI